MKVKNYGRRSLFVPREYDYPKESSQGVRVVIQISKSFKKVPSVSRKTGLSFSG